MLVVDPSRRISFQEARNIIENFGEQEWVKRILIKYKDSFENTMKTYTIIHLYNKYHAWYMFWLLLWIFLHIEVLGDYSRAQ